MPSSSPEKLLLQAPETKKGKQSFGVSRANALQECLWFPSEPAEQPLCATWQPAASSLSTHTEKQCKNSTHAPQGLGLSCLCIHKHIPFQLLDEKQRDRHMKCVCKPRPDGPLCGIYDTGSRFTYLSTHTRPDGGGPENFPRTRAKETFPR